MSHSFVNTTSGCNKVTLKPWGDQIIHITFSNNKQSYVIKFKTVLIFKTAADVYMSYTKTWHLPILLSYIPNSAFRSLTLLHFSFAVPAQGLFFSFPLFPIIPHTTVISLGMYISDTTVHMEQSTITSLPHEWRRSFSPPNGFSLTLLIVLFFYKQWDVVTEERGNADPSSWPHSFSHVLW